MLLWKPTSMVRVILLKALIITGMPLAEMNRAQYTVGLFPSMDPSFGRSPSGQWGYGGSPPLVRRADTACRSYLDAGGDIWRAD